MRILVVEDTPHTWRALQRWLAHKGHYAYWASKSADAIRFLVTDPIDLVLLDVDLGAGQPSGIEVARVIVADERLAHLPIILLTGLDSAEIRLRERVSSAQVMSRFHPIIITKPIDLRLLEQEMFNALQRAKA